MKRTICALLAVFLLLSLLPLNAAAAQSGELNGAVRWSLDDSGTLTISGTGAMPDYVYNYTYDGWSMSWSTRGDWQYMAYADQIRSVVVGEGITSVGMGSFMYMPSLQSVRLPDSVRTISAMAFFGCQALTDINVPAELEEIGELEEFLPPGIVSRYGLMDRLSALRGMHFPVTADSVIEARRRMVFEEFLLFILSVRSLEQESEEAANHFDFSRHEGMDRLFSSLPYELTKAQQRVHGEIS